MTVRERVLTSRLIQKIDNNEGYAKQIGLSYMIPAEFPKRNSKFVQKKEKKN